MFSPCSLFCSCPLHLSWWSLRVKKSHGQPFKGLQRSHHDTPPPGRVFAYSVSVSGPSLSQHSNFGRLSSQLTQCEAPQTLSSNVSCPASKYSPGPAGTARPVGVGHVCCCSQLEPQ